MHTNYRTQIAITLLLGTMLLGAMLPATAAAQEHAPAAQVTLKSWLKDQGENNAPYAVNQQITLYLELATNRWFTAGTRIGQFELPGSWSNSAASWRPTSPSAAMAKPGRTSAGS